MMLLDERRSDSGFSLTELMIASLISLIALALFLGGFTAVQTLVQREEDRSDINDQTRLAVQRIDREVRSGNVIIDPALESPANYSVRVFTQSNAPPERCVQYRVVDRELQRREWEVTFGSTPPDPLTVVGWSVVAEGIVNAEEGVIPFSLSNQGRTLDVSIIVNPKYDTQAAATTGVQLSITGRNTEIRRSSTACQVTP